MGETVPAQATPQPSARPELYILVLAGAHDPRQHHPYWYKLIGVFNDDELNTALSNGVASPEFVSFNAGAFAISCDNLRWQIAAWDKETCDRLIDVAKQVFDGKLTEVSISAIGTNCALNLETGAENVGLIVVESLERSELIPAFSDKKDGSAIIIAGTPERLMRIEVGQSIFSPSLVSVAYNVQRQLPKKEGHFALFGELQHCESDWRHGRRFAEAVAVRIRKLAGK